MHPARIQAKQPLPSTTSNEMTLCASLELSIATWLVGLACSRGEWGSQCRHSSSRNQGLVHATQSLTTQNAFRRTLTNPPQPN